MPQLRMLNAVMKEYGIPWMVNRALYSAKITMLRCIPSTVSCFEKKTRYPSRLDIFNIDIIEIKSLLDSLSVKKQEDLIKVADNACEGIIHGFSSLDLDYGNPFDWQLNPLTGRRCDENIPWFKIPDFDEDRGDIKVIWEASRFSHFVTLARAYLLTQKKKYYQSFSEQLNDWLEKNQYGYGANYKCGQECSLRMVNALLAYTVFRNAGLATDADRSNIRDLIDRCYRKILSNFFYAYKCIKNNHTISELMGIIAGSWCCRNEKQLDKAVKLLDEVINEQFTVDGGYRQFSFNYQRLALQDLVCVLSIEAKINRSLSVRSKNRIKSAALLMYQCQDESGEVPNYGSNDGALVFHVHSCGYRDFSPVINTAYALITGKQLYDAGKHQEELLWFSGGTKLQDYSKENVLRVPSQFIDAGLFTMRGCMNWAMIVLNEYKSRPAHMDQFHFDLWVNGINVLCDSGTYSYTSTLGMQFVRNESHNTAVVEGGFQMNVREPFMVYNWSKREINEYNNTVFEGTMISVNGYQHYRRVERVNNAYRLTDSIVSNKRGKKAIIFHTPCDVNINGNSVILTKNGTEVCKIKSEAPIHKTPAKRSVFYLKCEQITEFSINISDNMKHITEILITKQGAIKND